VVKKQSIIDKHCAQHASVITQGTMFSIDPSIGSQSSQPGYAVWKAGELEDSGIIRLGSSAGATVPQRLFHLRMTLEKQFNKPDIVIVERIVSNPRARNYNNTTAVKMNQAIGVVMSQWDVPVIEVSPSSWKAVAKSLDWYEKSDEHDAIVIGQCCINKALTYLEGE
jgi:hypothetical protein